MPIERKREAGWRSLDRSDAYPNAAHDDDRAALPQLPCRISTPSVTAPPLAPSVKLQATEHPDEHTTGAALSNTFPTHLTLPEGPRGGSNGGRGARGERRGGWSP